MPNLYNALLNSRAEVIGVDNVVIGIPYDPFVKMGVTVSPTLSSTLLGG